MTQARMGCLVGIRRLALAGLVLCATWLSSCVSGGGGESIALPFVFEGDTPVWEIGYSHEDDVQSIDEFVRPGQTVENWTELVTVQRHKKAAGLGSVDDQIAAHRTDLVARCPHSTVEVIRQTPDGVMYEAHVVNCRQGADEHALARVFDGTSNRFLVSYAVRGAVTMTPQRRAEWIEKLMAVQMAKVP